ncbi:MAG: CarD family transcriptional regulator [Anaerofustis sp.]
MFRINDYVVYATSGVCRIVDIITQDFGGVIPKEYYVIKSVNLENLTVFLPTENDDKTNKLRYILTEEEIRALLEDNAQDEKEWIEDNRFRSQVIKKTIVQGNPKEIFALIKMIRKQKEKLSETGKKVNYEDEKAMNDAAQMLCDEFAFVLNIKAEDAEQLLSE